MLESHMDGSGWQEPADCSEQSAGVAHITTRKAKSVADIERRM